jgi:L-aminopeptidase/D-esterase-like protein
MIKPGPRNLITDVPGLRVGNAEDKTALTGVTVILGDAPLTAGVDVRGGAPGNREISALDPACLVNDVHALVLAGGSVFGLAAADGVAVTLSARGVGLPLSPVTVPVVPGAILYDLVNGGDKNWGEEPPYAALGRRALASAHVDFAQGNAGAGLGAKAGSLKGGLGSASATGADGIVVGALAAVNSFGNAHAPDGGFWAGYLEQGGEFGGLAPLPLPRDGQGVTLTPDFPKTPLLAANTSLGVVATNATLTKAEAERLAIMAQDGFARALRPVHTPFDGDTVFALSTRQVELTGEHPLALAKLGALAADCLARAVIHAVLAAESIGGMRAYRDVFRK